MRRRDWVVLGFVELVMERASSRDLVLRYRVLYTGPVVGAVDGVVAIFLVRLHVRAATGSFAVVFSLFVLGGGLVKVSITLGGSVFSSGTLVDDGMSDSICGGGIGSVFGALGDVCSFLRSVVCVRIIDYSVGGFVWVVGKWRLIRVSSAVASRSRSFIGVSPFPFYMPFVNCSRFQTALVIRSVCVMVGFVMCLCWNTTVSDTRSALVFLTWKTCAR